MMQIHPQGCMCNHCKNARTTTTTNTKGVEQLKKMGEAIKLYQRKEEERQIIKKIFDICWEYFETNKYFDD